ncbi:MAG: MFS transporter [Gammaproteobacteria bacterium]|nr:MFS transporter [Gammaproteobacteria bacterium]MDP6617120.1 MFS transporter [Gammaproteobacteria bacterium]MDP6695770.1 MFS transporter [Gammaproteobacteria bacterium]
MNDGSENESTGTRYPDPGYAWYVVVILTIAYVFSFLDRQILNLLVEPIRADLGISDTQMSLLQGLAFGIFYTLLGIPIGRLADRRSRRAIIATGITIWCLMTAACGLARNFVQLFIARVGIGVGEATLNPSAYSLISDYFPRKNRARPLSFYNMGVSLGAGIAMVLGGQIIAWVFSRPPLELPVVGELFQWQTVFLLVGLPGLLVAVLMITVREPKRQDRIALGDTVEDEIPIREVARFLWERKSTYLTLFIGMSVVTIIGYGYFSWIPAMFIRTWGWSISQIAFAYGLVILIFGPLGINFGGWLADRWYRKGRRAAHMRVTLIGALITVPSSVLVPLMPTPELAVVMLAPATIGAAIPTATAGAALMMIVPNQMRAQTTAIYYFVINVLGLTIGPLAIALVTDRVFMDESMLRYSIAIVSGGAGIAALGFLFANIKYYRQSVIEADAWSTD